MIINHKKQWDFLVKSAELGKLPHALLFYGQKGLGKKDFSVEFAKFFIGAADPPDFILVEPTGPSFAKASAGKKEIQINQIRNLIEKLSFKPYAADFKMAVINKAHLMTSEAQNCFLKFLEEPRKKTFLILITEYPQLLLSTILSRVQKIRFYSAEKSKIEEPKELASISNSDLATRFQYAKDISKENLEEVLDAWLRYFREILLIRLRGKEIKGFNSYSLVKLKDILNQIQLTKTLISATNVNSRMALEILLMQL